MSQHLGVPLSRRRFLAAGTAAAAIAGMGLPLARADTRPVYVDGLSFLPADPSEIARSQLSAFLCDVSDYEIVVHEDGSRSFPRTFAKCDASIRAATDRIAREFPDLIVARNGTDLADPRTKAVFQFQGCDAIGDDLSRMQYFHTLGLRVLQLTHNTSNSYATAYVDEPLGAGLSALGREGVAEMNRVGLVPDVSHASEQSALDTIAISRKPVLLSHGACRALVNGNPRAATDRMIRAVADSGGIFGVFMMSFWLTVDPVPTAAHYVAQIRHAVNVAGIDAVGVANDYAMGGALGSSGPFDNATDMEGYRAWWEGNRRRGVPGFEHTPQHAVIPELNSIHRMRLIHHALLAGGFTPGEAGKIVGGNWMRFLGENLG